MLQCAAMIVEEGFKERSMHDRVCVVGVGYVDGSLLRWSLRQCTWGRDEEGCSILECVAVCCSVLQRVAACCSVLQCVAVLVEEGCKPRWIESIVRVVGAHGVSLWERLFTRKCCSVLQCVAVCCIVSVLQCVAVCCGVLWWSSSRQCSWRKNEECLVCYKDFRKIFEGSTVNLKSMKDPMRREKRNN